MADELTIDAEQYISSKRASDLSGYEQDYIGQLCRGGNIKARRVGGLWYVSADSLVKYKERADEYKPEPPIAQGSAGTPDSLVSFEGRGHISTSRAAKVTGYTPDYVGQLARAGTVSSRQVGNRWYVEQAGLLKHKETKDALLGAVQVQSVGLKRPISGDVGSDNDYSTPSPLYQYTSDNRELLPSVTPDDKGTEEETEKEEEYVIPIRVSHDRTEKIRKMPAHIPVVIEPRKAVFPMVLTASLFTIVIVLSFGFTSLKKSSVYTNNAIKEETGASQVASAGISIIGKLADLLEILIAPELVYRRPK